MQRIIGSILVCKRYEEITEHEAESKPNLIKYNCDVCNCLLWVTKDNLLLKSPPVCMECAIKLSKKYKEKTGNDVKLVRARPFTNLIKEGKATAEEIYGSHATRRDL